MNEEEELKTTKQEIDKFMVAIYFLGAVLVPVFAIIYGYMTVGLLMFILTNFCLLVARGDMFRKGDR